MKHKKLLSLLLAVCMVLALLPTVKLSLAVAEETEEIWLDFTANVWNLPTDYSTETAEYTDNYGHTITLSAASSGYKFGGSYLIFGKKDASLTLPAFDFDVERIVVVGNSGASAKTTMNIFVGDQAVSTETTGCTGTNTYAIAEDYQAAGKIYSLKVTNAYNAQVTAIKIYKKTGGDTPQPTTYTVSFDANGGTGTMADVVTTSPYTLPACAFEKTGNVFTGWKIDGDEALLAAGDKVNLTGNTTFVAQWAEASTYTKVTSLSQLSTGTYIIVAESANRVFNGTSAAEGNSTSGVTITNNTIIGNYASSELTITVAEGGFTILNSEGNYLHPAAKSITFDATEEVIPITIDNGEAIISATISNENYQLLLNNSNNTFFRFYKATNAGNSGYVVPSLFIKEGTAPATQYQVTLTAGEGTGDDVVINVAEGASYELPECSFTAPEGKRFAGWTIGEDTTLRDPGYTISNIQANITVTAQWELIPVISYTNMQIKRAPADGDKVVIYYPTASVLMTGTEDTYTQSGSTRVCLLATEATLTNDVLAVPSEALLLTVTVKANNKYTFSATEGTTTKYLYADGTDVKLVTEEGENTLFQLEQIAGTDNYFIKCDSATHNGNAQYLEYYGSSFRVWTMNANNEGIYTFQFFAEDGEGPTQFNTYTVSFNKNGGDGTMDDVELSENTVYTVPANGFTAPEGYRFIGWKVDNAGDLLIAETSTITITGDVELFAQWEEIPESPTKTYHLVTSADQLQDGDKIIIVGFNEGAAYALANQKSSNRNAVSVTVSSNKITATIAADSTVTNQAYELTLGKVTEGDDTFWTFYDPLNLGYLYAASSSGNQLKTQATVDVNAKFTLEIGADGYVKPVATNSSNRNTMLFNYSSTNPLFSCYDASTQNMPGVYIYKELTDGYYLIGPNGWTVDVLTPADQFKLNPNASYGTEYQLTTDLKAEAEFKVVRVENKAIAEWLPQWGGQGTQNYGADADRKIAAGNYTISFRPNYDGPDGDQAWFYRCICVAFNPQFMSQSLTLGDEIGVNFYVNLAGLGDNKSSAYMTFAITGRGADNLETTEVPFNENKTNDKGYYGFTCRVNVLQMADTITATLHYGDGQTVEKTYSVKQYIESFMANTDGQSETTVNLVMALADYGHYVQAMLAAQKKWTLGADTYAEMDKFYTTSYDIEAISVEVAEAEEGLTFENDGAELSKLTFTMVFDSATELRLLFKTPSTGLITATVNGNSVEVTTLGTSKAVQIKNISAHMLSTTNTVVITIDGHNVTIKASALSYAKLLLAANDTTMQNAGAAVYNYSAAADAFKAAH